MSHERALLELRGVLAILLFALLCGACASRGTVLDQRSRVQQFEVLTIEGQGFHHRAYTKPGWQSHETLTVYLEGDGLPFLTPTQPARNPHPKKALAWELMLVDPRPAVYLARPCYHREVSRGDSCDASLWTRRRYSEEVVSSMVAAISRLRSRSAATRVELVGYSGGGALALLAAPRVQGIEHLTTIAANLDLAAWTAHHGYSPLEGSLDPAALAPLPKTIRQVHLAGALDRTVPPEVSRHVATRQAGTWRELPEADHTCCWVELWPRLLEELRGSAP